MSKETTALGLIAFASGGLLTVLYLSRNAAASTPTPPSILTAAGESCYGPSPDLPYPIGALGVDGPIVADPPEYPILNAGAAWDFSTGGGGVFGSLPIGGPTTAIPAFLPYARVPPGGCASCSSGP